MKRADLVKWSQIVTKPTNVRKASETPIQMRRILAVETLERHLLLYGEDHVETSQEINSVCRELFSLVPIETKFAIPDEFWSLSDLDPKKQALEDAYYEYEDQFETGDDLTDDETMSVLLKYGFDFSDVRGQPLRCTKIFSRVIEMASKGMKGSLPDCDAIALKDAERSLAKERDDYLARKKRG